MLLYKTDIPFHIILLLSSLISLTILSHNSEQNSILFVVSTLTSLCNSCKVLCDSLSVNEITECCMSNVNLVIYLL